MSNPSIDKLIEGILKECTPTSEEEINLHAMANKVKNKLESCVSEYKLGSKIKEIVFGGSFAKGTWLKNEADIDIFIKFKNEVDYGHFEDYGKLIGMQALKEYSPYLRYADHPYVEAYVDGVKFNIVPCFDVSFGDWKSAADRSPFHTSYVISNLNQEKKNQVRVLKKFLKSLKIYGAEISIEGFSGYVCEVLILKFGSFLSTIHFFSTYCNDNSVIIITKPDHEQEKHKRIFDSFLVILDPIDENRNLGSAISYRSVATLIQSSRKFLVNPGNNYFREEPISRPDNDLKYLLSPFILVIEFKYSDRPSDVIWGQLKKMTRSICKFVESYGFRILKYQCNVHEKEKVCVIALLYESLTISKLSFKIGPEIFRLHDVEKFIEINDRSPLKWLDNDSRTRCLLFREFTNAKDYLEFVLTNKPDLIGIPRGLKNDFFRSFKIYTLDQNPSLDEHIKNTVSELLYTDGRVF
ncbi:CCA tRNA nucleotidyltransferase [Candidatus Nitrosocosmicus arcticus]|uniref:CCA-adding enzyme n=1 Tax=Candidatus Nitrosocosmicus arcticus TaxID=2035267 RepID=A0A557SVA2_9ARCH|nr:CCA tRNA nucleotidyltransferase [Candidatus Nitrosocosmicus arcticus]TVP40526.1 CCA-adding enzyme [Candidatus Nitrosocosmicus arcticus]